MKPLDTDTFVGRALLVLAFVLFACAYIGIFIYQMFVLLGVITIGPILWLVIGKNPILDHYERVDSLLPR